MLYMWDEDEVNQLEAGNSTVLDGFQERGQGVCVNIYICICIYTYMLYMWGEDEVDQLDEENSSVLDSCQKCGQGVCVYIHIYIYMYI